MYVRTVGDDDDLPGIDAVFGQNPGDGAGHGDHGSGAPVFPSRARVAAQPKIDAPRRDERDVGPQCRQRAQADSMRRVRVHDVDAPRTEEPPQREHRAGIRLERRSARKKLDSRTRRSLSERLTRARRKNRNMSAPRELGGQPERLSLATTPTALGIDVKDAHLGANPRAASEE
jgi:hypothetical protein